MTVELDIVERKNEENLKHTKQISDTMKKLILDENEPIASLTPTIADADLESTHANTTPSTDLQRFYAGKNIFITGGTGKKLICVSLISIFIIHPIRSSHSLSCSNKQLWRLDW